MNSGTDSRPLPFSTPVATSSFTETENSLSPSFEKSRTSSSPNSFDPTLRRPPPSSESRTSTSLSFELPSERLLRPTQLSNSFASSSKKDLFDLSFLPSPSPPPSPPPPLLFVHHNLPRAPYLPHRQPSNSSPPTSSEHLSLSPRRCRGHSTSSSPLRLCSPTARSSPTLRL